LERPPIIFDPRREAAELLFRAPFTDGLRLAFEWSGKVGNLVLAEGGRMSRPTIKARLDAEVKTWTDQFSDDVLTDATAAVYRRPTKVNRSYDIPYVAGYSIDGRTVFIDRHMPTSMPARGSAVDIDVFLVLHEMVEKSLLDEMRRHYLLAHQTALRAEQAAVRAGGICCAPMINS
jgi:hypothetical protein